MSEKEQGIQNQARTSQNEEVNKILQRLYTDKKERKKTKPKRTERIVAGYRLPNETIGKKQKGSPSRNPYNSKNNDR